MYLACAFSSQSAVSSHTIFTNWNVSNNKLLRGKVKKNIGKPTNNASKVNNLVHFVRNEVGQETINKILTVDELF